jgi:uncharacterized membrane protein
LTALRDRFLWIGCVFYAAIFTFLGAVKYGAHRNLVDFGIFQQTVASAFGCFCNVPEGSHWAFHFSPILYLAGAAAWLVRSPLVLVALQAVAGALCAPPIYAIVRTRSDVATARWSAVAAWLYPPLAGLIFGDFHENGFAPAAVAWTLYAFDARALAACAIFALITLAVKEDQAVFLACAGIGGAFAYRSDPARMRLAVAVAVAGTAVALTFFLAIQPHANANPAWQPSRFYSWTPDDWKALIPGGLLQRLGFLALIFAPLAFVPLRTRAFWLAVPPLAEVLASRMTTTFTLGTHYAGAWIGYVFVAFAAGIVDLASRGRARRALYWSVALCVVELAVANPLHPGLNLRPRQPRDAALDRFIASLPRDADVATQEEAYTHLASIDPNAGLLPENPAIDVRACFALIDRDFPQSPRLQEYGETLASLVRENRYVLVRRDGGIELYRSTAPACTK